VKLTKKHIGGLFDVQNSDGTWFYQLLDVSRCELLFRDMDGKYEIESRRHSDWRIFTPTKFTAKNVAEGWKTGRRS
jgi:hypothetical protein